jgi:cyanophycinase-like exopeptidase
MRGRIIFNGNGGSELIERVGPFVRGSAGGRPPQVLIVTAAWGRGEYDEEPIRRALYASGVRPDVVDGFDRSVRNLCAWHVWQAFLERRPDVAAVHAEIEQVREEIRAYYLDRTTFEADFLRRGARMARQRFPGFELGRLDGLDPLRPDGTHAAAAWLASAIGRELVASITALRENDDRMTAALTEAEEQLLARTGLRHDPQWQAERARLEERILEADAVLLFGGSPLQLLGALRFFDLRPAFLETLRRGATLVGTSAGALVLCERIIVFDDRNPDPRARHFQLLDRGLGLVGGMQVFPHCDDRIHTDDPDNLAYLARRFGDRLCAGLNRESYLLVELGASRATAIGRHDGVYVFRADGIKRRYDAGERIAL